MQPGRRYRPVVGHGPPPIGAPPRRCAPVRPAAPSPGGVVLKRRGPAPVGLPPRRVLLVPRPAIVSPFLQVLVGRGPADVPAILAARPPRGVLVARPAILGPRGLVLSRRCRYVAPAAPVYFPPRFRAPIAARPPLPSRGVILHGLGPLYIPAVVPVVIPDLRQALVAFLRADAQLVGLLGVAGDAKIRPQWRKRGDPLPDVTVAVLKNGRAHDLRRSSGTAVARVQLDVWAAKPADCVAIRTRVDDLLDGFAGVMAGLRVGQCFQEDETDLSEWAEDGSPAPTPRIRLVYTIRHTVRVRPFTP